MSAPGDPSAPAAPETPEDVTAGSTNADRPTPSPGGLPVDSAGTAEPTAVLTIEPTTEPTTEPATELTTEPGTGTAVEEPGGDTSATAEATEGTTDPEEAPGEGGGPSLARWAPWIIAGLFFVAYTALSLLRYGRMGFQSPDVTVFEQAIRNYAHFRAPIVDIKGPDFNHLGDHFHPLMVLMAPAYRLFPDPATLLVQQSFLFALSIVPVTRLAARRLGTASGACIGIAYGLSWGLQNAVNFDFHEICFGVPIMAFSLEAFLDRRWRACAAWALLLLLVKEDLGVTVAVIGFLLFVKRQRLLGAVVSASGVAAFFLIIFVVIPHFNPDGKYPYLEQGGGTDVTPWGLMLEMVDNRTKIWTLIYLFGITAFLSLASPLTLLVLPTLVWRFHSTNEAYWGRDWHYSAILMPIVFMAMLDVLARMQGARRDWLRAYALRVPAVVLTVAVMLCAYFPFKDFIAPSTYQKRDRQESAEAAIARIPEDSIVGSDQALLPYLAHRAEHLFLIGNTGDHRPEYLIVDTRDWTHEPDLARWADGLYEDARYTLVFSRENYEVFQRIYPPVAPEPAS